MLFKQHNILKAVPVHNFRTLEVGVETSGARILPQKLLLLPASFMGGKERGGTYQMKGFVLLGKDVLVKIKTASNLITNLGM